LEIQPAGEDYVDDVQHGTDTTQHAEFEAALADWEETTAGVVQKKQN